MKGWKRFLCLTLCFAMVGSLGACGKKGKESSVGSETSQASESKSGEAQGGLKAGTYTAKVPAMNNEIEVSVELTEKEIMGVKVVNHSETPGIGGELVNKDNKTVTAGIEVPVVSIPEAIVKHQSLAVDNVTGATITSAAIKAAVGKCIEEAGGKKDDWSKQIEYAQDKKDMEADVIIVGGGGAGLAAAITAAEQGKTVIIAEKNGAVGGNTLVCGAIYNAPDEALQAQAEMTDAVKETLEKAITEEPKNDAHKALQDEVKAQWEAYKAAGRKDLFDSKEWYALQTWNGGDKVADLELVKVLCYKAYEGLDWVTKMGMGWSDKISQGAGSLWQRTHTNTMPMGTGFISVYGDKVEALKDKITVLTETTVTELTLDGERVVGAKVKDNHSKQEYALKAKDGVIISTGGFSANAEMVQQYNTTGKWSDLSKTGTTNRSTVSQGDGVTMAIKAGAGVTDMDQIQLLYLGNMKDGQISKLPPRDINGTDQIIFINAEGKRFVREDGRRDEICLAVMKQPESKFYLLESGDGAGYKDIKDPSWRSADGFTFDYLKDNGFILVGDTLEDLAKQIGCDAATLKATVDTFNASVDSGKDEFGRLLYSTKLEKGPFVATVRQACLHHTMGGVSIDTEGHILNKDGKIIPGLYAAGEVTGGVHGGNRLGGNAVVDTVVFGKLAGDTLVKDASK